MEGKRGFLSVVCDLSMIKLAFCMFEVECTVRMSNEDDEGKDGRLVTYRWALATGEGDLPCGRYRTAGDDVEVKSVLVRGSAGAGEESQEKGMTFLVVPCCPSDTSCRG